MLAGLSVGQAAKFLDIDRDALIRIERADEIDADTLPKLLSLYSVRKEWLVGEVAQHDYSAVDRTKGAEKLTPHDRDAVAEFAAFMPRNKKSLVLRLEEIKKRNTPNDGAIK